MYSTKYTH